MSPFLPSMLYWNNLQSQTPYVMDLIQLPDGKRFIAFRKPDEPPHDSTALQTRTYTGAELKRFCQERKISPDVVTTDGRTFGLDPHDVWLTQEEVEYWRAHRSQAALADPNAPWVNGIAPKFMPA